MKILYIKNNSERNKPYQLSTTIFEKNGQKYVRKRALSPLAIPHLKKMKENYHLLSSSTMNPHISFAHIVDETEDSLTFEFIEGVSLEKKFQEALEKGVEEVNKITEEYTKLIESSFKMTTFDSTTMVTDELKNIFGDIDFKSLDGSQCFDGICNIDQIFSNIIYKEDQIYMIDYEWTYNIYLPVEYIFYRTFEMLEVQYRSFKNNYATNSLLYHQMERHFIDTYVMKDSFYHYKQNYLKKNTLITTQIEQLQSHVAGKENHINELAVKLHAIGEDLAYARKIVSERDEQIATLNQQVHSMRLKSRIKQVIKYFLPFYKRGRSKDIVNEKKCIYKYKMPQRTTIVESELSNFKLQPLISIIMPVYNVKAKWLKLAINSIEAQWYENWELCIADDKSTDVDTIQYLKQLNHPKIKITYLEENLNISGASNAALEIAQGDYIALMDNDDEITPDALYEMIKAINEETAEFIYSDEDFITTEGIHINPHFKPDFSPDLLHAHNYITHFTCFKKTLLEKVGHFNPKFDGSQDYDLFLRLTEQTQNITHIPKVLYHWRMLETSTSVNSKVKPEALEGGKILLEEMVQRTKIAAKIEYGNMDHYFRVKYTIQGNPLVSIIIPFKDKAELLLMSINSILEKSTYKNYEIIGISNNSKEPETFKTMVALEKLDSRIKFYEYNVPFNYAKINNYAVNTYAKGEHVLLLNNDIEIISEDWIESMLEHSQRNDIGCVGAKLYYPNETIQHAGIIIGLGGYAGHSHKMYPRNNPGYFNRLNVVQNLSAVTAACLMIQKYIYQEVEGMDEIKFKIAYNDVDFCLRVREQGYLNIYTPYAQMYHHESVSRGYETTPEKIARFQTEKDALAKRHTSILTNGDPYYNPNLSHDDESFSPCN